MKRLIPALALLVLGATSALAQHDHGSGSENLVKGADIPRNAALRTFLTGIAEPSGEHSVWFTGMIGKANLSADDSKTLGLIMEDFAEHFAIIRDKHNKSDESDDVFWTESLIPLVSVQADRINTRLSKDGAAKFWKFLDGEKASMAMNDTVLDLGPIALLNRQKHHTYEVASAAGLPPGRTTIDGMTFNYTGYLPMIITLGHTPQSSYLNIQSQVSGSSTCPGGICPSQAVHYGDATAKFMTYGGTAESAHVLPQSFLSASTSAYIPFDVLANDDGSDLSIDAVVHCTVAGQVFLDLPLQYFPISFEFAWTYVRSNHIENGTHNGVPTWSTSPRCQATSGVPYPDNVITTVPAYQDASEPNGWVAGNPCVRPHGSPSGTPWVCSSLVQSYANLPLGVSATFPEVNVLPYEPCTNYDKGYKSWATSPWEVGNWPWP